MATLQDSLQHFGFDLLTIRRRSMFTLMLIHALKLVRTQKNRDQAGVWRGPAQEQHTPSNKRSERVLANPNHPPLTNLR
jgi:hypothetical protein